LENLISQNATSNEYGGRRKIPFVFTEQGVAGLSGVLKVNRIINTNLYL
jgi:hypothetical protein